MMARRAAVLGVALSVILASAPAIARGNPACDRSASPSAREHNPNCTIGGSASRILDGRVDDWVGESTRLGGTWQVSRGELVYQDYIYDDYGAQGGAGAEQRAAVAGRTKGTARYPRDESRFANNAADLLQLRLTTVDDDLWGLVRLGALREPDTTVAAIAVDTNGDLSDTTGVWPREAGVATPGADRVITIWADADGTGHGEVVDLASGASTLFDDVAVSTVNEDNAFEFKLPLASMGGTSTWTLWAGTGLWDSDTWMAIPAVAPTATEPGSGSPNTTARLFNVAFRDNERGHYFEDLQAAALEANDIAAFSTEWSPGAADIPYVVQPGRVYEAVVDQGFSIPPLHEGASTEGVPGRASGQVDAYNQSFDFLGRWQPYGVYLPQAWSRSRTWPMLYALHGRGGTHGGYFAYGGNFQQQIGEGHPDDPMVLITPLGRGRSHYDSWGEGDLMAVLDDAIPRFAIDTDRISLAGYSMGGLGIYRLGTLLPDRWASVVSWAGASSELTGNWVTDLVGGGDGRSLGKGNHMPYGNFVHLMGNLRDLPILLQTGSNDELLPITGQIAPHRALDALDYRYAIDVYAGYGHLSWGAFDGPWSGARDWIGTRSRATKPRTITYTFSDSIADPTTAAELGLRYGNAWWVSDLARRDADPSDPEDPYRYGTIAATSRAIAELSPVAVRSRTPRPMPHPHLRAELDWVDGPPQPLSNALDVALTNLSAATIDMAAADLTPAGLSVRLTTDGASVVLLRGTFSRPPIVTGHAVVTIDANGARIETSEAVTVDLAFPA